MIDSLRRNHLAPGLCALALVTALGCRNLQESLSLHRAASDPQTLVDDDQPDSRDSKSPPAAEAAAQAKPDANAAAKQPTPNPADAAAAQPATADKTAPALAAFNGPSIDDDARAALATDAWSVIITMPGVKPDKSGWRYRNPALDQLLRTPADERPRLDELVDSKNPIVAANAAIVQLRWRQAEPVARLTATVRRGELRIPVRFAAIEALAGLEPAQGRAALEGLLKQFGDPAGPNSDQYISRLHGELLLALARCNEAAAVPYWAAALNSPDVKVRLIALAAIADSEAPLPAILAAQREDTDPSIRAAALGALARHHDPKAFGYLRHALDDYDHRVQLAAVAGLGEIKTSQSRAALEKMMHAPGEVMRSAVVESLAALDADDAVNGAVGDKAPRVRQAVAIALARSDGMIARRPRAAVQTISTLIGDRAPDVQRAAVAAVSAWPLEQAGPILMAAMHESGYSVRKTAAAQLAQRWAPAADFPSDSTADRRTTALDALNVTWIAQFGPPWSSAAPRAPLEAPFVTLRRLESQWRDAARRAKFEEGANPDGWMQEVLKQSAKAEPPGLEGPAKNLAEARSMLAVLTAPSRAKRDRDAAIAGLKELGAAILPLLDEIVVVDAQPLPEAIYTDVLPALQSTPVFDVLHEIETAKPAERWTAAERLAAYVAQRPLPPLALMRLADVMVRENDSLVWQSVLATLVSDPREPASRLAAMAVGHDSPEVRRRAAEYFAQHGSPAHAALLMPLLEDSQLTVVLAAVKALGASGPLKDAAPLVALLARGEPPLRLETALALIRLNAPQGRPALERLADDVDPDLRRSAAMAIGGLEDEAYAPILIKLLDDRHDVAQAALAALVKIAGRDIAADPAEEAPATLTEKIHRWRRWQSERAVHPPAATTTPDGSSS